MMKCSFPKGIVSLVMLACSVPTVGQVSIDIDGAGTMFSPNQLSGNGLIDLDEGNLVVQNAGPLLLGILPAPGTTFQAYFQTSMTNVVYDNGVQEALPTFSFPPFFNSQEITAQFSLPMQFTGFDGLGRLNLEVGAIGANSVQFFYDTPRDANIPTGNGFNDGINILSGTFTNLDFAVAPTLISASTFEATVQVTGSDPNFFQYPVSFTLYLQLDLDGLVKIPPQIPNSAAIVGYTPGPTDLLASLDLTAKIINVVVPEVSSMVMLGTIAAGSIAVAAAKRRRQS